MKILIRPWKQSEIIDGKLYQTHQKRSFNIEIIDAIVDHTMENDDRTKYN
jgi:hypothetical protein